MNRIVSFLEEGIDDLSTDDRIDILCSTDPITRIVQLTNCENPKYHNILLEDMNAPTVKVVMNNKLFEIDQCLALNLLHEAKKCDILQIIEEIEEYLDPIFVIQIKRHFNRNPDVYPKFRQETCKPNKILREGITVAKMKKLIKQQSNH